MTLVAFSLSLFLSILTLAWSFCFLEVFGSFNRKGKLLHSQFRWFPNMRDRARRS
jgi:hypothetical protein